MKVICIDENWVSMQPDIQRPTHPIIGNEYNVTEFENVYYPAYQLAEFEKGRFFKASHFAKVSDISETEFEREYNRVANLK